MNVISTFALVWHSNRLQRVKINVFQIKVAMVVFFSVAAYEHFAWCAVRCVSNGKFVIFLNLIKKKTTTSERLRKHFSTYGMYFNAISSKSWTSMFAYARISIHLYLYSVWHKIQTNQLTNDYYMIKMWFYLFSWLEFDLCRHHRL